MSPEMTKENIFEFKNDIYILGLTFYFMLTGKLPEIKQKNFFDNSIKVFINENAMDLIPEAYSKDIKHFISKLLTVEVDQRPSARRAFTPLKKNWQLIRPLLYLTTFHCATCLYPGRATEWLNKTNLNIGDLFKHRMKTRLYNDINKDSNVTIKSIKE